MKKFFLLFGCFTFLAMSVFAQKSDVQLYRKGALPNEVTAKLVRVSPTPTRDATTAHVILTAGNVWGDGTGYQMLLDADHTAYGVQIPATGAMTSSGNVPAATYNVFEYKIPTNADGALTTSNIVLNNSIGIDIPAGIYDFCITNPTPGDRMWIASNQGPQPGRADDFEFLGGYSYEFVVSTFGDNDGVTLTTLALVPTEIALTQLITPVSGQNLTATEPVKVTFKNLGMDTINSVDLYLTVDDTDAPMETYSTPIAPGASVDYTFQAKANLSAFGPHTVIVTVDVVGDANSANNKIEATITNIDCSIYSTLPFEENFEGGAVPPNTCWENLGNPGWFHSVANASYLGTYFGSHTQFAFFDDDKWGNGKPQSDLYLVTPALNLSTATAPKLKFDYLYRRLSDKFTVEVSVAGGAWQLLDTLAATQTSSTAVWVNEKEMSLAAYAGQSNVRIAFHYNDMNGWKYGVAIDNIKVWDPVPADLAVVSLVAPVAVGRDLTSAETVTVKVKNNGSDPITAIDFYLSVDGTDLTPSPEAWSGTIAPTVTFDYTFTAKANLSAAGNHEIIITADVIGDPTDDNKLTATVENLICAVTAFPLVEDFQSNTYQCWTVVNTSSAANEPFINSFSAEPENLFFIFSSYSSSSTGYNQYLISPVLPNTHPVLAYSLKYYFMPYSTISEQFEIGYSTTTDAPAAFTWGNTQSGTTTGWQELTGTIPADAKYFAIHYFTDYGQYTIIDDINIYEQLPYDVAVTAITSPNDGLELGEETVTVTLKNFGENTITAMNLYYTVGEEPEVMEVFNGSIASGASTSFSFQQKANLAAYPNQDVDIKVVAELTGDGNATNDSYTKTVHNTVFNGDMTGDIENNVLDFALQFQGWTQVDLDGQSTYGFNGLTFPNSGYTGSFIAFNPSLVSSTIPQAHSGSRVAACFDAAGATPLNNDWLITPRYHVSGAQTNFKFWVNSYRQASVVGTSNDYGMERFVVWVSTNADPTNTAAYTKISTGTYESVSNTDWAQKIYSLGAYDGQDVYVAIQCVSADAFYLYIDDIEFEGPTGVVTIDFETPQVSIYPNPAKNVVNVQVEETSFVKVYNVAGKLVDSFTATAGSNNAYQNVAGVYFFNINGKTYKVVFE